MESNPVFEPAPLRQASLEPDINNKKSSIRIRIKSQKFIFLFKTRYTKFNFVG
jgi:hypothetical protein